MSTKARRNGVIATRTFQLRPRGARVKVSLGTPEPDPRSANRDWRCPFRVSGSGATRVRYAHGIDAFQSLQLALVWIRALLEPKRRKLKWDGGTLESAFPRMVPYGFGHGLTGRIEKFIDREVKELCRELERRHKKRAAAKREA
jgi:hypothetical protein